MKPKREKTEFVFVVDLGNHRQTRVTEKAYSLAAATQKVKEMHPGKFVSHQGMS